MQYVKKALIAFFGTSAVFLNELIAYIFNMLGDIQRAHTQNDLQETSFRLVFSMEYLNIGLIQLALSFDSFESTYHLMNGSISANDYYTDFNSGWYMQTGNAICIFIFASAFLNSVAYFFWFALKVCRRAHDRRCRRLQPDEDDDVPNTRQKIQEDLEDLYTGRGFQGEKTYSRMMSTLFVILMYSSGIPILYYIGAVFYVVNYLA